MAIQENDIVLLVRFILDHSIKINQVDANLWKISGTGTVEGLDYARTYATYNMAALVLAKFAGVNTTTLTQVA